MARARAPGALLVCLLLAFCSLARSANLHLVVSLCKERRLHFLKTIEESMLYQHNVTRFMYAKCGPHELYPDAILLENLGREGHTYWWHMQRLLDEPELAAGVDAVMFVNGGSGTRGESVQDIFRVAHSIALQSSRDSSLWYVDPVQQYTSPLANQSTPSGRRSCRFRHGFAGPVHQKLPATEGSAGETASAFVARARRECVWEKGGCCKLCPHTGCCLQFGPDNICPQHEQRVFDDAVSCEYLGKTEENYRGVYPMKLQPAEPANYVQWLASWGIHFSHWEAVWWHPQGNFAASADAIRALGRERVARGVAELERAGKPGGMVGMFYERAWRSLFALLTCDADTWANDQW